jgi:uncharacterized protein with FMN-binding domain
MRRAALALVSTVAGLVVLLSFKTHSAVSTPPAAIGNANTGTGGSTGTGSSGSADDGGSSDDSGSSSSSSPSSSASSSTGPAARAAKTVTGDSVDTQFGPVQVQVTVKNGKITNVSAVEYPQGSPRDQEINSFAIPQLNQEVLSSQSGQIDSISGATFTSEGYIGSLQSALNKAGL